MHHRVLATGVFALSIGILACDEPLSDLTGPTPLLEPTFSSIQEQIFENGDSSGRVACIQCHNATGQLFAGRLNLEHTVAYAQLVDVAARNKPSAIRVVPGRAGQQLSGSQACRRAGYRRPANAPERALSHRRSDSRDQKVDRAGCGQ